MLINNVSTERRASLIVKNSAFYIEIAKFVQAYTTIVKNPNEFLQEINQPHIDKKTQHLSWEQMVEIMQKCDLGFTQIPTRTDLIVYYNYALEMGSVDSLDKKIATVGEVAEAQKHYYNFVDDAKDRAEEAYQKQRRIVENRRREMGYVDGQLTKIKARNWVCAIMMFIAVAIGMIGATGFFIDNVIVSSVGKIIPVWQPRYVGAIIMLAVMVGGFILFNNLFVRTKRDYVKLNQASATIFTRGEETYLKEQVLKRKLDALKKEFVTVQTELNDKNKKFDVKHNIDVLKTTNKYYQRLCEDEESLTVVAEQAAAVNNVAKDFDDDFAPIKLTKDQEENMRGTKKEAIMLEGQIDMEAFTEKFESKKDKKDKDKEETKETQEKAEQEEKEQKEQQEAEAAAKAEENKNMLDSVNQIREILGMNVDNDKTQEK
ncbi:MAG: hypothetical protein IJ310_01740 [Clostridia bacterium]|nr:hypothetical protein [Clostridia bacterium]